MGEPKTLTHEQLADALEDHALTEESGGCASLQFIAFAPEMREAARRLRALSPRPIEEAPSDEA